MAAFDAGTIEAILRLRDEFTGVAKRVATQAQTLGDRLDRSGAAMSRAGSALTPLSIGVAALGVGALKAAIDFESSFAGVIKTVDDATDSMGRLTPVGEELKQSFRDLALEIPVSANELAGIGEVAGQLGIETQNIAGFTETMAKLGVTTNLSAEEAATALARLANVTGLPQTEFERLGSTVVALGNNLATTESEIVMFGQRIAGAGAIAGLSEPQILAIGGAMSSVGIEAEAGGTAVQKALLTMNDAVAAGGAELVRFADLSGQSVEQFAAGWRDNAGAQFTAFVEGLAAQGDQASAVLKELIGTDQRLQRAFLSLAQSGDTLRNAMSLANVAWVENTALAKEAEIRFQTTSAELTILWNNVKDVAISLGDALLPTLKDAVGFLQESVVPALRDAAEWFEDLSPASKGLAAGFAALIVVATPVLFTLSTMAPLLSVIVGGFAAIVPSAAAAGVAVGASGTAAAATRVRFDALFVASSRAAVGARAAWVSMLGPIAWVTAAIVGVVAGVQKLRQHFRDIGGEARLEKLQSGLASVTATIERMEAAGDEVPQTLRDVQQDLTKTRDRALEMADGTQAATESFTAMRDELKALAAKDMAAWANASEEAKERAKELADALPQAEVAIEGLRLSVEQLAREGELTPTVLRNIAKQALATGVAVEDLPPELQNIVISFDNMARAAREAAEEEAHLEREATRLKESIQELADQFQGRGLIQSALEAAEAVRHVGGVSKLTADDHDQLRETVNGAIDAYQRMEQAVPPVMRGLADQLNAQHDVREATRESAEAMEALRQAEESLLVTAPQVTLSWDEMLSVGQKLGPEIHGLTMGTIEAVPPTIALADAFAHLKTEASETLAKTHGFFAGVSQGFQDLWKGISGGQGISGLLKNVGSGLSEGLGQILSGGIASAVNAAVGLAWTGLKKLGGFFKSLFGGASEAELAGRETAGAFRDGVIATLTDGQLAEAAEAALGAWRGNEQGAQFLIGVRDAYVAVGRSAAEAEGMVNRLWEAEARGPEAVAAVQREMEVVLDQAAELRAQFEQIAQLQTFDSARDQLQQLTSAAEFFGVEADEMGERLGNAFLAVEQAASAEDIAQHFHTLLASGVDLGTALDLAKDKVQGVITASLQMGTEIPAAMQPIAAQLIEQGQLFDESGKKITDINQLEFAPTMTDGIQVLVLSMNQLIETMGGEVPAAAQQFADGVAGGADAAVASVEQVGQAVDGVATEDLPAMAQSFDEAAQAAESSLNGEIGDTIDAMKTGLGAMSDEALPDLAKAFEQTASQSDQALQHTLRDQIDNIGLAVHDLSAEELTMMAAAFEVTAQEAGLSLEGVLGEKLDALKAELESTTRDELPGLARAFQQTATDAVQAFDRIPRTLTFEHRTRYSSSGSPGATNRSGFQSGTHGRFVDFGGGTSVVLHGRERVVTEAEGRREASDLGALRQELADLTRIMERGQDELPFRMSRAIRDAMAETV